MTKIRAIVMPISLVAVVMTSVVARADRKAHAEKYCSAQSAVGADVAKQEALGPSSTLPELRKDVEQEDRLVSVAHHLEVLRAARAGIGR